MVGEGEGEVHDVDCGEFRIGGGRGKGGNRGGGGGWGGGSGRGEPDRYGFPIFDEDTTAIMKKISPSILPNFHGLRHEDPKKFLFGFEVLCRTYDYLRYPQNLKLFPTTLKDGALKWFMGLGTHAIRTWDEMKIVFLEKYKDYCMPHNIEDEVFKMIQKEGESLEDMVEICAYNIKKAKKYSLGDETLKALLLKSIKDEWIDLINLMGKGYVSQLSFVKICDLCKHISRGKARVDKNPRDHVMSRINKSTTRTVSRAEIGNLHDNLKKNILGSQWTSRHP